VAAAGAGAAPSRGTRVEAALAIVLGLALVVSRIRLVATFGTAWTDEDQALLWYATSELLDGRLHEPYFYGQPYGSWLESLLAAPMVAAGVPFRVALPTAAAFLGIVPWLLLAGLAWLRRRPLLTISVLALPVAMSIEGSILATMPRGLLPGVVVGVMAAVAVLAWPTSSVTAGAFGLLLVVAASMNVGSGLVTGPVAVWFGLTALSDGPTEWRRRLVPLAAGLAVGGALHALAQSFYRQNPAHDVHHSPAFQFLTARMTENAGRLWRYLPAYAPEPWRNWLFLAAVLAVVLVVVVVRQRTAAAVASAVTLLTLSLVVLGTAKANDGTTSIFFPWARVYLGLPWALAAVSLLPAGSRTAASWPTGSGDSRRRVAAAAVVAAVALGCLVHREVRLQPRLDQLLATADGQPPVAPVDAVDLERRCDGRERIARATEVAVIVDRYDRTAAYACSARFGGGLSTLFPEYDRRTWLLETAEVREVGRLLVAGLDGCPAAGPEPGDRCEAADPPSGLFLLQGRPRPITTWAEQLGIPVRPT